MQTNLLIQVLRFSKRHYTAFQNLNKASGLTLPASNHEVPDLNPPGGGVQTMAARCSIAKTLYIRALNVNVEFSLNAFLYYSHTRRQRGLLINIRHPASILNKSIAGRSRPVSYPDGPITARCRFMKNAYWAVIFFSYLRK